MKASRAGASSSSFTCASRPRASVRLIAMFMPGSLRGPEDPAEEWLTRGPRLLPVGKAPDVLALPRGLEGVGRLGREPVLPARSVGAGPGFEHQVGLGVGPQREAEDGAVDQ